MIGKEIIKAGFASGVIEIVENTLGVDLGCRIGEIAFYFDSPDIERYDSAEDYLAHHTAEEIVDCIYETIKDETVAAYNGIYKSEYDYYKTVLEKLTEVL